MLKLGTTSLASQNYASKSCNQPISTLYNVFRTQNLKIDMSGCGVLDSDQRAVDEPASEENHVDPAP